MYRKLKRKKKSIVPYPGLHFGRRNEMNGKVKKRNEKKLKIISIKIEIGKKIVHGYLLTNSVYLLLINDLLLKTIKESQFRNIYYYQNLMRKMS